MGGKLVYAKTAKGIDEVAHRSNGLGAQERRILIMIDGKRDFATVSGIFPLDVASIFTRLEEGGFIVRIADDGTILTASEEKGMLHVSEEDQRLVMARIFLINSLSAHIGVASSGLVLEIEAASNIEELRRLFVSWRDTIQLSRTGRADLIELEDKLAPLLF